MLDRKKLISGPFFLVLTNVGLWAPLSVSAEPDLVYRQRKFTDSPIHPIVNYRYAHSWYAIEKGLPMPHPNRQNETVLRFTVVAGVIGLIINEATEGRVENCKLERPYLAHACRCWMSLSCKALVLFGVDLPKWWNRKCPTESDVTHIPRK